MNRLQGRSYIPVLRTREAELKGLANIAPDRLDRMLPVIEFTRSRRSRNNPTGAISKSIEKVAEILGERPYIADLTTMQNQSSSEISALLDHSDSFRNWTDFVANSLPRNAIPSVHLTLPFDAQVFIEQVGRLWTTNRAVAFRVPIDYPDLQQLAATVRATDGAVVVLADAGYVRPHQLNEARTKCAAILQALSGTARLAAPICSSFPSSVTLPEYGGRDDYGKFGLLEVELSDQLKRQGLLTNKLVHGDYALVHPLDFEGTVTNWVPRVDVPLDREVFYHRVRRPQGGYVQAATNALQDRSYVPLNCWGHDNIVLASQGDPLGRSPSHWIAVRVNFHMSRQVERLR